MLHAAGMSYADRLHTDILQCKCPLLWLSASSTLAVHCIITDSDATVHHCLYLRLKVHKRDMKGTFSVDLLSYIIYRDKQINTESVGKAQYFDIGSILVSVCPSSIEQSRLSRLWLHAGKQSVWRAKRRNALAKM